MAFTKSLFYLKRNFLCFFIIGISCVISSQTSSVDLNLVDKAFHYLDPVFSEGSVRAAGMGGAMGALGADPTAIDINPAGAGLFIDGELSLSLGFDNWNNKATFHTSEDNKDNNFKVSQISGILPFTPGSENWKKIVFGVNYTHQPYRPEIEFSANRNIIVSDYDNTNTSFYNYGFDGYTYSSSGSKDRFSFFLGSNYKNKLYLGASLNFQSYTVEYQPIYNGYLEDTQETYQFNAFNYPYSEIGNGISFSLGFIYRPVPIFRFGASYQTPTAYSNLETTYRDYAFNSDGSINESVLEGYYEEDDATGPGFFTLSSAVVLNKNWALNVDYIHTFNSNLKYKPNSFYNDTNDFISDFVKNTSEFKIGSEYVYKNWSFRAGYSYRSSPISGFSVSNGYVDGNGSTQNKDIENLWEGSRKRFSAGVGYDFGAVKLNMAFIRSHSNNNILMYGTFVDPGFYPVDLPNYLGSVKNVSNSFMLGMYYSFK